MVYTHDRNGKPIPPQVLDILNRPVPLKPRKKRTASMVSTGSPPRDHRAKQRLQAVPNISDVPDLARTRKQPSRRVPCESPLGGAGAGAGGEDAGGAGAGGAAGSEDAGGAGAAGSEDAGEASAASAAAGRARARGSPLAWLKAMLDSVKTVKEKGLIVNKVLEEEPVGVKNDSPEWSGCKVLETFKVSEKPGYQAPARSPRLNSNFYRILALEHQMCSKGKLGEPSVSMLIQPRSEPSGPQCVLGIQQTLPRRRDRRWRELTEDDFA